MYYVCFSFKKEISYVFLNMSEVEKNFICLASIFEYKSYKKEYR